MAIGLLIAAAIAVPAAPARAQELGTPAAVETAPVPQEAALEVDEALDRAQAQIGEAVALGLAQPAPASPQPAAAQEPGPVEQGLLAEPEPAAIQAQAEAGVDVALQPPAAPSQPSGAPEDSPPARSPDPLAPARPSSDQKPDPAVEPERRARRHASDGGTRMVRRLDARLRAVERGLHRVRRYVDAGAAPPPRLLVRLRRGVQRLLPAIAVLERHAAPGLGSVPGLDAISERLESARGAAAALVAAFTHRAAERTPQTEALIEELVALQQGLPKPAPADRARRRTSQTLPAHGRPTASHPRVVAYTQADAAPAQAQSGSTAATEAAPTRTQKLPEGPRPWPAPPATGAAAGPSGSFFSFAGPAALALLLGLAIPRVLRRLARLPAGRQPESFWSPPERPG